MHGVARGAVVTILLLGVAMLAGCLDSVPPALADPGPASNVGLDLDWSADGCDGSAVILLVAPSRVEPYLAPGFRPRDAQDLLVSLPAASGQVPVFLASIVCTGASPGIQGPHQVGFIGILVQPPAVAGIEGRRGYDILATDLILTPGLAQAVAPTGLVARVGNLTSQSNSLPNGGAVVIVDAVVQGASAYRYIQTLPAPIDDTTPVVNFAEFAVRIWQADPAGLSLIEYVFTDDVPAGSAVCFLPSASPVANLTGSTTCLPGSQLSPTANVAAAGLDVAVVGRFRHLPGVLAQ